VPGLPEHLHEASEDLPRHPDPEDMPPRSSSEGTP
jgi:hypothetical protein